MLIESLGLPGSGKTTLARACRDALNQAGQRAVDGSALDAFDKTKPRGHRRIWRDDALRQSYHSAAYLERHLSTQAFFQGIYSGRYRNLALVLAKGAEWSRYMANRADLHSYWSDESFLHFGVHGLLLTHDWDSAPCVDALPDLLKAVPLPDVVIYTEISPAAAERSVRRRAGSRPGVAIDRKIEEAFGGPDGMAARARVLSQLTDALQTQGVSVIRVTALEELETMRSLVLSQLGALDGAPGPVPGNPL